MGSIKGQKHNPYIEGRYAHINKNDVVFTPEWLAKQICGMFSIVGDVLEPCKGEGAFLKYLPAHTEWCEIADGKNYYDYAKKVNWIVTNPPYSDFDRFLKHSFNLADNIVLLVPVAKMFKSMGTLNSVFEYGGFVSIHTLSKSCGCNTYNRIPKNKELNREIAIWKQIYKSTIIKVSRKFNWHCNGYGDGTGNGYGNGYGY